MAAKTTKSYPSILFKKRFKKGCLNGIRSITFAAANGLVVC